MDLYDLLDEDRDAPGHRHSRELTAAHDRLMADLVAYRKSIGLKQEDIAERMDTDQGTVSRIESRTTDIHLSTLRRYLKAVGAVVDYTVRPYPDDSTPVTIRTLEPYHYSGAPASSEGGE